MTDLVFSKSHARRLWFPRHRRFLVPPRLVQLLQLARCRVIGHDWKRWRVETEEWFEYVDEPQPYAMRGCDRGCGTMEHARPAS